jgi:hypothetical protein
VITDSPLFLTPIYDSENRQSLKDLALEETRKCNNLNIFIDRIKEYNPNGRNHDLKEAQKIDNLIIEFLIENKIDFITLSGDEKGVEHLVGFVMEILKNESK